MLNLNLFLNLPGFQLTGCLWWHGVALLLARYEGPNQCPDCHGTNLRSKGRYPRPIFHHNLLGAPCFLLVEARKFHCRACGRHFRQRFPGVLVWQRATEAYREHVFGLHRDGINRRCLGRREGLGAATVERWFQHGLARQFAEWHPPECPLMLGLDEHFFTRRKGFVTTLCDLKNHKVYDVVLGRSELALEAYFQRLEGKHPVQLVCIDLATHYRALVTLGDTLYSWRDEIARMWRSTRNNAITEGFHNKMGLINRQAYGFRNFENYRMRVKVLCG